MGGCVGRPRQAGSKGEEVAARESAIVTSQPGGGARWQESQLEEDILHRGRGWGGSQSGAGSEEELAQGL